MALERAEHTARGDIDAFDQRLEPGIARRLGFGWNGIQRALEVVCHLKHIAREIGDRIGARILNVARGAAAQVLHFGSGAQRPVLKFLVFLQKPHQGFVVAFDTTFGAFGSVLRGLDLVGRAFVFCLVAHRVFHHLNGLEVAPDIEVRQPKIKGYGVLASPIGN